MENKSFTRVLAASTSCVTATGSATTTRGAGRPAASAAAPIVGAHLNASIRTGTLCRYQPAPGGPARWQT